MLKPLLSALALFAGTAAASAGGLVPSLGGTSYYGPGSPVESAVPDNEWSGGYAGAQIALAWAEQQTPRGDVEADGSAFGVHAGYLFDFGRFVAGAELSWSLLRDMEVDGTSISRDGNVLDGWLIGGYDLDRFLPYAFVGVSRMSLDADDIFDDEKGTGVAYGLGAKFRASDKLMLGIDWTKREYGNFDDIENFDLDTSTLDLGVSFRF